MAFGGGTWTAQNKVLPGSYINFVAASRAGAGTGERGIVTVPMSIGWGPAGKVIEITQAEASKTVFEKLGYPLGAEALKWLRELLLHAETVLLYRVDSGDKADNTYAEALYAGARGNDIGIAIIADADREGYFDVVTYVENTEVDRQSVNAVSALTANEWVTFKTFTLEAVTKTPLTGGTNTAADLTAYQAYLDAMESYSFNIMAAPVTDSSLKALFTNYVKRMRDEEGIKFQVVLYNYAAADYEGVISVCNADTDGNGTLIYWVAGAEAGCELSSSCMNMLYDGEYDINANMTQAQLESASQSGQIVFHRVGSEIRVLYDVNTLKTYTQGKDDQFSENQTIRVIDQIANDIAAIFNTKYIGKIPNDESGRASLWNDIVEHHYALETAGAISDFDEAAVEVEAGEKKGAVVVTDVITIIGAMTQLYMTVTVG